MIKILRTLAQGDGGSSPPCRYKDTTMSTPEHASHAELGERLIAIKKRAIEREKLLKEVYPKFVDTHAQAATKEEYGALWSLDVLYWVQDYCDGFIDDDEE